MKRLLIAAFFLALLIVGCTGSVSKEDAINVARKHGNADAYVVSATLEKNYQYDSTGLHIGPAEGKRVWVVVLREQPTEGLRSTFLVDARSGRILDVISETRPG